MSLGKYELRYLDSDGNYLFNLEKIVSLQYGRKKNDEGIAVVELPGDLYDFSKFDSDHRLEIYRTDDTTGLSVLQGETCWFLRSAQVEIDGKCNETLTLTFYDTISLLKRRIVAWLGKDVANYPSVILEPFDDIIKYLYYYNFNDGTVDPTLANTAFTPAGVFSSSPAISFWQTQVYNGDLTERQFPITMQVPSSLSSVTPTIIKFDFENCLTAMQDVAENASLFDDNIWFDIVYTPASVSAVATFDFQTWTGIRGVDRSASPTQVIIGPEYGNLTNAVITRDWTDEITIFYAGGNGDNELRIVNSATESRDVTKPFYPIEGFVNASNTDVAGNLVSDAQVSLVESRPIDSFSGTFISKPPTEFNKQFGYGDFVYIQFKDISSVAEVAEYEITVDSNGEEIQIPFGNST